MRSRRDSKSGNVYFGVKYPDNGFTFVTVGNESSGRIGLSRGMPHWPVLGSPLFLLYMTDLTTQLKLPRFIFADIALNESILRLLATDSERLLVMDEYKEF